MNTNQTKEIKTEEHIKFNNLVSFRKWVTEETVQSELFQIGEYMRKHEVKRTGPMISTTHNIEERDYQQVLDMEFLFPIDQKIELPEHCHFKPLFHLINAVFKSHVGTQDTISQTYEELELFMKENKLQQITPIYNININEREVAQGQTPIIDIYIGVNPSVL